jgi:tRNA-2-methylthio-N6-dimethylallyladenosine synthase
VQSGSDRILDLMNRKHTADDYRRIIGRIRERQPGLALSSDFIVGFPGETDADFDATMRLVEEIGFAFSFSFKYSPRPGTPASGRDDQVPEVVKSERLARLQKLLETQRVAYNQGTVGQSLDVLIEKPGRLPGQMAGKSPYLQPVQFDTDTLRIGEIARVRIVRAGGGSLFGELIKAGDRVAA